MNRALSLEQRTWTIVLAAGEGTRLRSLTRALHGEELPKQFAVIQGGRSLLQTTLARASRWSPSEQTVVVVAKEREDLARSQVRPFHRVDVVAQPKNLGTGPGLLLPLARVLEQDPKAIVVVTPSDHYVQEVEPFVESVKQAEAIARKEDSIVLIGAVPDRAETQYGWILPSREQNGRSVSRFYEKPESAFAEKLFTTGALWNTFMVVGPAERLWALGRKHLPVQTALFETYRRAIGTPDERNILRQLYEVMPPADFSHHVLERAHGLQVVPLSSCGWSDWGTPERVLQSLRGSTDFDRLVERLNPRPAAAQIRPSAEPDLLQEGHRAA